MSAAKIIQIETVEGDNPWLMEVPADWPEEQIRRWIDWYVTEDQETLFSWQDLGTLRVSHRNIET